jgi:transcription elongation GreA/GreB family factor
MNATQMKELIAASKIDQLESAWIEAVSSAIGHEELSDVLGALVASGRQEEAQTLAMILLEERSAHMPPGEAIKVARSVLLAVPGSGQLREYVLPIFEKVYGSHPLYRQILASSGLSGSQSAKRAVRTIEVCLAVGPGNFLANRFDNKVLLLKGYNEGLGEFEAVDASGKTVALDPKNLADEFEPAEPTDFRVLCQHRTGELGKLLTSDISAVLIGICQTHGGQIDSGRLRDELVPKYISAEGWGDWWSSARTAIKRNKNLATTGRNPVIITYHAAGQTLEQELAPQVKQAKTPLALLALCQQYVRELRDRRLKADPAFAGPLMEALAQQAQAFKDKRPSDALAAVLSIDLLVQAGLPAPAGGVPSAAGIISDAPKPASAVLELADTSLWPGALDALCTRPDAAAQLEAMLGSAGPSQLDELAARLHAMGRDDAVNAIAAAALADPVANVDVCAWLWKGPSVPVPAEPSKIELLSRMLKALQGMEHDWERSGAQRKRFYQGVRAALSASDYAVYRRIVGQMDEPVADTVKRLIERGGDGLAQTVHDEMLAILRESFFKLFVRAKVPPWLDENSIWTTKEAYDKRQRDLKDLQEVKIPENARAIGAAAAHGDLSENSEWKFAIEERDLLAARSKKISDELAMSQIINRDMVPTDTVAIGSKVTLRRTSDHAEVVVTFLGAWDSDLDHNVFSYQTALAQSVMGLERGSTVTLKIGSADEAHYEIVKTEPAPELT